MVIISALSCSCSCSSSSSSSSSFLPRQQIIRPNPKLKNQNHHLTSLPKRNYSNVRAANLPAGMEMPKVKPKLTEPFLGFTRTAEIWNSRACMLGIIGTFVVELILHKGILQIVGVDVGKGLDLPL